MAISEQELMELRIKQDHGIKLSKEEKALLKSNSAEEKEKKKGMSFGERLLKAAKSEYASLGDEDKFPIREYISTGNFLFNSQISSDPYKGVPTGRVVQFSGIASTGKSYLALETAKNAMDKGYFVVLYDSESAHHMEGLKQRGLKLDQLMYVPIDTVENLKTSMLNILEEVSENDKLLILLDSLGNLSTNKEIDDSMDGSTTKDMSRAAQVKSLFRTVTLKAGIKNVPIIAINHVYTTIGLFTQNVQAGGSGVAYNSSIITEFSKAQEKGADGKMSGALVTSTLSKGRLSKERTKIKFTIDFEDGITPYSGMQLFCEDEKIFVKEGRSFKLNPMMCSGIELSVGESFTPAKMNNAFWDELMEKYLAQYLRNKFSYQSSVTEILDDIEENIE
jgi:RecA/RadA recombinase